MTTQRDVMITLEMTVYLTPKPKGRPRMTRWGRVYTPPETVKYENEIRKYAQEYMSMNDLEPLEGAVALQINFFMPIPKTKQKKGLNGRFHTSRPDLDNLEKSVGDALNEIWFADDSQVVKSSASKVYSDLPRIEIKVTEICE